MVLDTCGHQSIMKYIIIWQEMLLMLNLQVIVFLREKGSFSLTGEGVRQNEVY